MLSFSEEEEVLEDLSKFSKEVSKINGQLEENSRLLERLANHILIESELRNRSPDEIVSSWLRKLYCDHNFPEEILAAHFGMTQERFREFLESQGIQPREEDGEE